MAEFGNALVGILQRHRNELADRLAQAEARVVVLEAEKAERKTKPKISKKPSGK